MLRRMPLNAGLAGKVLVAILAIPVVIVVLLLMLIF
jgi:hypothetical protein